MIQALISGQAARVAFIEGTNVWYIDAETPTERHEIPYGALPYVFGEATDIDQIDVKDPKETFPSLLRKYNIDRGMQMLDIALNGNLSDEIRFEAADIFSEFIENEGAKDDISNFTFAHYNPDKLSNKEALEELFLSLIHI